MSCLVNKLCKKLPPLDLTIDQKIVLIISNFLKSIPTSSNWKTTKVEIQIFAPTILCQNGSPSYPSQEVFSYLLLLDYQCSSTVKRLTCITKNSYCTHSRNVYNGIFFFFLRNTQIFHWINDPMITKEIRI